MKKYIVLSCFFLIALYSCDEKTFDPVVVPGDAPVLTTPSAGTDFVLNENEEDNVMSIFDWTAADFGYQAGIDYTVQLDAAGNDFAEGITLGIVNALSLNTVTVGKINNILLAKGLPFGFANELEVRVCASVSDDVQTLCSGAVAITINPYQAEVIYPKLTIPGDYQGWDPADENYAIYSRKSDEVYEGYIYFNIDPAFYKFAQGLSWDVNWGDNAPADGILDPGGDDIPPLEGIGLYLLICDLNSLTYTPQKIDWGVLGDATAGGWDTDEDLVWDDAKGALTITTDLTAGNIRFRANDASDLDFGDNFTNGTLEYDGDDIPITEAGNYTIDVFLTIADYAYTLTKN